MSTALRLSDILGQNLAIEWYEAVALVREVAERVLERPGHAIPELHQVSIDQDGGIAIAGGMNVDEPVRRLGQLLQATLAQSGPPVQLRLIVAQATAPAPQFPSIRELDTALAFFERPNRRDVLRGLYARVMSLVVQPRDLVPTLDMIAPLHDAPAEETVAARPAARSLKKPLLVAAAAVVVGIAVGVAYVYSGQKLRPAQLSAAAVKASDAVGGVVVAGISSVSEKAGLGRLASAEPSAPPPQPVPVATTAPAQPPARRASTAGARPKAPPFQAFDLELVPVAGRGPLNSGTAVIEPVAPLPSTRPQGSRDRTIYSAADNVTPPVGVRPQLPRELPSNVSKQQLARIELVILPDGTVGSVKLLDHRNVHDAMFLSAVKAWEFRPAVKDGEPVSYRKIVWMAFE